MNPYQHTVTCSVCGGGGVATSNDSASEWFGGTLTHQDPSVCRYYLDKKEKERKAAQEDKAAQGRAEIDADDEYMFEQMEEANENN